MHTYGWLGRMALYCIGKGRIESIRRDTFCDVRILDALPIATTSVIGEKNSPGDNFDALDVTLAVINRFDENERLLKGMQ
jgi:hypothetical protein